MKIVEINSCNFGSTGNIMLQIVQAARECGHEVITSCPASRSNSRKEVQDQILIGNRFSRNVHLFLGEATGMNGLFSVGSTLRFLRMLDKLHPDLIHLHNLHNCYINLPLLFRYIKKHNISVVWTLHDCWAFTGRCPYFQLSGCDRWKTGCHDCPYPQNEYPATKKDRSNFLWKMKKKWFTGVQNMTIVTPSQWLADLVKESFLSEYPVKVINNGIDLNVFKPSENDFRIVNGLEGKKLILAVAMGWDKRKGYADMLELAKILDSQYRIVMVGVSKEQLATLPSNILGIERTNSQKELAEIYSASDVFVNTTYEDNYPTVNLEARACGLPVITYKTGGSPESAGADATLVETGDVQGLKTAIEQVIGKKNVTIRREEISSEEKFAEYTEQYNSVCVGGGYSQLDKDITV